MTISWKTGLAIAAAAALSIVVISSVSVNDGGYRTVIQGPTGTMSVKFTEGWYVAPFSKETQYPNVVSYDLGEGGLSVRYQDGGKGTVDGNVRVQLPNDEAAMLKFHREFLSVEGAMSKLVIPEVRQALNQTAGLLTSEEAYAEKRSNIAEWAEAIMENGRFVTRTVTREVTMSDGTKQRKQIPEIATKDGSHNTKALHLKSTACKYQASKLLTLTSKALLRLRLTKSVKQKWRLSLPEPTLIKRPGKKSRWKQKVRNWLHNAVTSSYRSTKKTS
jgi:hypothetical protein